MSMIIPVAYLICFIALSSAIVMTLYRLFGGPTLADRVISTDLLGVIAVCFIAIYSMLGKTVYVDAAVVLSLIAFLSTVAFARYVEQDADKSQRGQSK